MHTEQNTTDQQLPLVARADDDRRGNHHPDAEAEDGNPSTESRADGASNNDTCRRASAAHGRYARFADFEGPTDTHAGEDDAGVQAEPVRLEGVDAFAIDNAKLLVEGIHGLGSGEGAVVEAIVPGCESVSILV